MREPSLETSSFVPPFLGRQMTSCLYSPYPTPERLGETGQTPAGEQEALGIDNGRRTRGFPSTSCCSWPRYRRRQRDGVGSSANFHSYQHEGTAVRWERGPFKCHTDLINYGPWRTQRNAQESFCFMAVTEGQVQRPEHC